MIFATVGTQLPFPRLIEALDRIAGAHGLTIVAQTADATATPRHLKAHVSLTPQSFEHHVQSADRIVAHAGIGTLLTAKRHRKPLIFFPRLGSLGEHRNDHQLATIRELQADGGFAVAMDETELCALLLRKDLPPVSNDVPRSRLDLIAHVAEFIGAGG